MERLWQPWIEQGDVEARYQLAYHYLWCSPCDDDATRQRMETLLREAAAQDHPDAIWFLAGRNTEDPETDPEYARLLLRAGQLGSVHAQRDLGALYATGDWSGPKDPAEGARWYRLAAEQGHAGAQYALGFMLLRGEGGPKTIGEGLEWLERAGEAGDYSAFRLLEDCYANGFCDVTVDPEKAARWRERMAEIYHAVDTLDQPALDALWEIPGVTGFSTTREGLYVSCDADLIEPAELDWPVPALGITKEDGDRSPVGTAAMD